jgi:hypothetical protein
VGRSEDLDRARELMASGDVVAADQL